ncbi:AAA family ATPase [bacterium]|nr:AAA family ATPase [bacterium]
MPPSFSTPPPRQLLDSLPPSVDPRLRPFLLRVAWTVEEGSASVVLHPLSEAGYRLAQKHLSLLCRLAKDLRFCLVLGDFKATTSLSPSQQTSPRKEKTKATPRSSSLVHWAGIKEALVLLDSLVQGDRLPQPLLFFGPPGVGKTRLLQRASEKVLGSLYLSSQGFTERVVRAARTNRIGHLKSALSSPPLLLVDDLQALAGRKRSLEVLLVVLTMRIESHLPTLFALDRTPQSLQDFPARLSSRLGQGLSLSIPPLDQESRKKLLQSFARSFPEVKWPPGALSLASGGLTGDVRALQGFVHRYHWGCTRGGLSPKEALAAALGSPKKNHPSLPFLEEVSQALSLLPSALLSKVRHVDLVRARRIWAILLLCREGGSRSSAARIMGVDPSTIAYAVKKGGELWKKDLLFTKTLSALATFHHLSLPFSSPAISSENPTIPQLFPLQEEEL